MYVLRSGSGTDTIRASDVRIRLANYVSHCSTWYPGTRVTE